MMRRRRSSCRADRSARSPGCPTNNRDFLGNEFLLWLWHYLENESDTLKLSDDSEVALMISRTLHLECPRGQFGHESISSDGPSKLPEAALAPRAGKLPAQNGVDAGPSLKHVQYELTLQAESLAINGVKLPAPEAEDDHARHEERVTQLRHLLETLDLMYAAFIQRRLGEPWTKETARMKKWLHL